MKLGFWAGDAPVDRGDCVLLRSSTISSPVSGSLLGTGQMSGHGTTPKAGAARIASSL